MSMDLMVKAMKTKVGNPLRKLVLLKLADNANDLGECWPSHQHIADQCEISRRSVINHISALEKMGLLTVESRVVNGEKKSNIYHLKLDRGSASPALGSASPAQPSSASPAHRTSHSFESVNEPTPIVPQTKATDQPESRFEEFWKAYPNTGRRVGKAKCRERWKKMSLDTIADQIIGHVLAMKNTKSWREGFEPSTTTYINQQRWEDGVPTDEPALKTKSDRNADAAAQIKAMARWADDQIISSQQQKQQGRFLNE